MNGIQIRHITEIQPYELQELSHTNEPSIFLSHNCLLSQLTPWHRNMQQNFFSTKTTAKILNFIIIINSLVYIFSDTCIRLFIAFSITQEENGIRFGYIILF